MRLSKEYNRVNAAPKGKKTEGSDRSAKGKEPSHRNPKMGLKSALKPGSHGPSKYVQDPENIAAVPGTPKRNKRKRVVDDEEDSPARNTRGSQRSTA